MKKKLIISGLILSSLIGYLEWGPGEHEFLFQSEFTVIKKLLSNPRSAAHPFTLIPLFGQLMLVLSLFQKQPINWIVYSAMACLGLMLLFMFFIGLMSLNLSIFFSTVPFIVLSVVYIFMNRKRHWLS